jgi:hypothetical protein
VLREHAADRLDPELRAIDLIATNSLGYSPFDSATRRTARSRISAGHFEGRAMDFILPTKEVSGHPAAVSERMS